MFVSRYSRMPRRKLLLATADAVFTALAMLASVVLRLGLEPGLVYFQKHWEAVVAAWFFFGVSYYVSGLYDAGRLYRVGRTLTVRSLPLAPAHC